MSDNQQQPLLKIREWLNKERELGSCTPDRMVLATATPEGIPHSRVVAIREMSADGIIFFTQQGSRKVSELAQNPHASMTLWLPLQQRQVILDGTVKPLNDKENERYWNTMPRDRQLYFSAYAKTSGQPISCIADLESRLDALTKHFAEKSVPMSTYYCGFSFDAKSIVFYTLGIETFSEVIQYIHREENCSWDKKLLSP